MTKLRLKDIAKLADVSTATVARVLKNKGYVSADKREIIERVIREMNYVPNKVAQGLKSQRTGIIGHILPSMYPNLLFAGIADGVDHEAMDQEYHVLSLVSYGETEREAKLIAELASRMVDGIVITQACAEDNVRRLVDMRLPVVMIERTFDIDGIDKVLIDAWGGSYEAAKQFLAMGHTAISFIGHRLHGEDPRAKVENDRYMGFRQALEDSGISENPQHVSFTDSYDSETGYTAMERLLDSAVERPTAVFISSDMLAIGVLRCLYDRNIRVPEDLSIIGFDDTYSGILSPRISTIAIPIKELGRTAAGMILDRIQGGAAEAEARTATLQTRYIDRGSVKDLKA